MSKTITGKSKLVSTYKKGPSQGMKPTPAQGKMSSAKGGHGNKKPMPC